MFRNQEMEYKPRSILEELQAERLRSTISRVWSAVPFYRQRLDDAGIGPEDIRTLDDLARVLREQVQGALESTILDGRIHLTVHGRSGLLPNVVQVAERHGYPLTDLSLTETTLETVFIHLTGKDLRE